MTRSASSECDVILVRYCPTWEAARAWTRTLAEVHRWGCGVLTHDNTDNNIGLTAARIRLLEQSRARCVVLMDFDFNWLRVDLPGMLAMADGCGMVEAHRGKCNLMVMRREVLDEVGGLDSRYFVAYADWDLMRRIEAAGYAIREHGPSSVGHAGLSRLCADKRAIWARDRAAYEEKWQ